MNIDQLPNNLQLLARKRREEESNTSYFDSDYMLKNAFEWGKTKEGGKFWEKVYIREFDTYKELYPKDEWIDNYPGEYQVAADAYGNTIVAKVEDRLGRESFEYDPKSIKAKLHTDSLTITPAVLAKLSDFINDSGAEADEGIKEEDGKISYELDWEFIEAMAARMSKNKGKYEPYNWHKPIEVEKLKQSLIRHVVEIMKGNYEDDGDELGHLAAVALNTMMLNYQLKLNKDEIQSRR